jgi:hypothetical protein
MWKCWSIISIRNVVLDADQQWALLEHHGVPKNSHFIPKMILSPSFLFYKLSYQTKKVIFESFFVWNEPKVSYIYGTIITRSVPTNLSTYSHRAFQIAAETTNCLPLTPNGKFDKQMEKDLKSRAKTNSNYHFKAQTSIMINLGFVLPTVVSVGWKWIDFICWIIAIWPQRGILRT